MWLRVITVAELTDADGACVSPDKFDRRRRNTSTYLWPNIPRPSEKMFEMFQLYVRKSLCSNAKRHHRSERLSLDKRLGAWHQTYRRSKNKWHWTPEWVCHACVAAERNERTTRYRKSTSLDGDGSAGRRERDAASSSLRDAGGGTHTDNGGKGSFGMRYPCM